MNKSDSIIELTKALIAFQSELKPVPKDSINPFFHSKYADLSTIWESIRPLLVKHGFAVSQLPRIQDNQIILTTLLLHTSGEWLSSDLLVTPIKPNDPQAAGSALTYARRYALSALLGICSEEDDDAEAAVGRTEKTAAPAPAASKSQPSIMAPDKPGNFANAGEFLTACAKLGFNKTQVLNELKVKTLDNVNLVDAYQLLKKTKFPAPLEK